MKQRFAIIVMGLLFLSLTGMAQPITIKKCATCGRPITNCQYKGKHPKPTPQPVQKCKTCGKVVSACAYKGKHPIPAPQPVQKCATCGKPLASCEYGGQHTIPKCSTCGKTLASCEYGGEHPKPKCATCGKVLAYCEYGGEHPREKAATAKAEEPTDKDKVYDVVEQMPEFPGGMQELRKWLSQNIRYPAVAEDDGYYGRCVVQFVVGKDGRIEDAEVVRFNIYRDEKQKSGKVVKKECYDTWYISFFEKECIRLLNAMPLWKPGNQNGTKVRVKYSMPISFKLQ